MTKLLPHARYDAANTHRASASSARGSRRGMAERIGNRKVLVAMAIILHRNVGEAFDFRTAAAAPRPPLHKNIPQHNQPVSDALQFAALCRTLNGLEGWHIGMDFSDSLVGGVYSCRCASAV